MFDKRMECWFAVTSKAIKCVTDGDVRTDLDHTTPS